ncbi:zinc-binding protein A33-like [Mercenaria mercenaria]|uniref:zinc-binding protein A33-like n=1 Tax=Mercenaria mercenaria TaxID=6596 RepID=UPI00234FAAC8|nr:zinc-binding protein A33-like [Mercenaria mercenaria]
MAKDGKFAKSQIDASEALYDFPCNPCAKDGKNMEAKFQCLDCQMFYCNRCVTGHNKFTANHNVVERTSKLFGQKRSLSSDELPRDLCEEHRGEVIKMFCGQHDRVCCTVCIALKHRSCEGLEYIPNIAKGLLKKEDKDQTKTSLEKVKDDLQNLKSKMQNEFKKLNVQRDSVLDVIQKFKKRLIANIEELERKSIKEVQEKHKEITDELTFRSKIIDDMLNDVEQQLDKLKHVKRNNEAQLFVDIKVCEEKISSGSYCVRQSAVKKMETLVFEVNRSIEKCLCEVQSLGKLTLWSTEKYVVYDSGNVFEPVILDITDDDLIQKFMSGVTNVAAVSLNIGYPTAASAPHSVANGFKRLLAVACDTDITFHEAERTKEYLADPSKFATATLVSAALEVGGATETKKVDVKEESEESDDDMGYGLFD